jgi:hypothetical protein
MKKIHAVAQPAFCVVNILLDYQAFSHLLAKNGKGTILRDL